MPFFLLLCPSNVPISGIYLAHMSFIPLPITDPTWIFFVVLGVILFTPMLLERLRIPSIVGLIVVGVVIGPHGVHLLNRDASFEIFGKVGLYYIMFMASLSMNLTDVMRHRYVALSFGLISFALPFALGLGVNVWALGMSVPAGVLVASMYAAHTLLTYPVVMRWGLSKHRSVGIAVGSTIITNILTLLVLAIVGGAYKPDGEGFNFLLLGARLLALSAAIVVVLPWICRRFFRRFDDNVVQYIFVLTLVFLGAGLMEWVGMEGILGAFLVGLALNREIPPAGPLMSHIDFVGNALFVPYFLIGVGMIINVQAMASDYSIFVTAGVMIVTGAAGKILAAHGIRLMGFSAGEAQLVSGLSTARAAATLAIALVGYEIILPDGSHLLGDDIINAAMFLILGSCIVASTLTDRAARKIVLSGEAAQEDASADKDSIIVALSYPNMLIPLTNMALMLRTPSATAQLTAVTVVLDDDAERRIEARRGLDYAAKMAAAVGVRMQTHCRRSVNAVTGITHTAGEHEATDILIGLHSKKHIGETFYGKFATDLIASAAQQIMIYRPLVPIHSLRRLHIIVPRRGEFDPGLKHWCRRIATLAEQTACRLSVYGEQSTLRAVEGIWQADRRSLSADYHELSPTDGLAAVAARTRPDHMAVFVLARRGMPSYHRRLDAIPGQLERYFSARSWMLIVPARSGATSSSGDGRNALTLPDL